ncbi:OmpA family protein [Nonlabens sp.]|uniref:OmpA family protein n=1 Tax=Nonlabens sp. TaxID=1888209 RepID=UPI003F6A1613
MKKIFTITLLMCGLASFAQTNDSMSSDSNENSTFKQWSLDLAGGVHMPVSLFTPGYFTNTPDLFQMDLGIRYMVNEKFGFNLDLGYNRFEGDTESLDFQTNYYRVTLEGVVNARNLIGLDAISERLGLLVHGGMGVSGLDYSSSNDDLDHMLNFQAGITPEYRITNAISVFADLSVIGHVRQDRAFDGFSVSETRGFDGMLVNASVGISFALGEGAMSIDYAPNDMEARLDDIAAAMDKMATENGDDDQDGVPNYLDRDNTTESGVRVDNKGRAIDLNKNGIPDDMESGLDTRYVSSSDLKNIIARNNGNNKNLIKQLINEGYVNVYFRFNSTKPTTYSLGAMNTIVQYMKDNPSASATLTGFADEIGNPEYNKTLSERRAKMVNDVLVAAGIDASRLTYNGDGEDASVDKSSAEARQLVRRVTFRVN